MRIRCRSGHGANPFLVDFSPVDTEGGQDVSRLLAAWNGGDGRALDDLISIVYPEIRKIARRHLNSKSPQTLESAALANEAYLRLVRARGICCEDRLRFLALCGQIIRRLIGEYARRQRYQKRGGSAATRVSLDEAAIGVPDANVGLSSLHEALESLSKVDHRKYRLLELHCFGGLTIDESAQVLGVSPETAKRDWKLAKAWLRVHLSEEGNGSRS